MAFELSIFLLTVYLKPAPLNATLQLALTIRTLRGLISSQSAWLLIQELLPLFHLLFVLRSALICKSLAFHQGVSPTDTPKLFLKVIIALSY